MRNRTLSHQQLLYKQARGTLVEVERDKLVREEAGYGGEILFDCNVGTIAHNQNLIHIKNFLFDYDEDKECQIDNIVIANDIVYIFEIKNFNFDVVIDNDGNWTFEDGHVMEKSPTAQALAQKFILMNLFKEINIPLSIESFSVFMNPAQMIYGLYPGMNVLLSFQLDKKLPLLLKPNNYDFTGMKRMIELRRKPISKYYKPFDFDVKIMKKGIVCDECFKFIEKVSARNLICRSCNRKLSIKDAVRMMYLELKAYNPELKITSNEISELSGGILTSATIRKNKYLRD